MGLLLKLLLLLSLLNFSRNTVVQEVAPEICNNGKDDDNDGLIDLNDDDCYCEPLEPPSLIPNPSFEQQVCCPDAHSQINCATGWIRASEGTPDYFHACDYDGTDIFTLPQPIPDGEGFIGIIDGSFTGHLIPGLKEYAAACLTTPTKPDTLYRLEFYTGFLSKQTSPDIEIALFGTTDCANVPFGIGDKAFGCPSNSPDWIYLGSANVSGQHQWQKSQFKFRTDLEITAVAIGPGCRLRSSTNNTYHFLDELILRENAEFDLEIRATGQPCTDDLYFEIRALEGYEYQWYKNGIAIPNATDRIIQNPPGGGRYQVRLKNAEGCKISEVYTYAPPSDFVSATRRICAGESLPFGNKELTEAGIYWDTLSSRNFCDSIVKLELLLDRAVETHVVTKIFPDESYYVGPNLVSGPGDYAHTIPAASGCDSTVYLHLEYYQLYIPNAFSPNGDGVNDVFSIYGNTDLQEITSLKIFGQSGALVYHGESLPPTEGWDGTVYGKKASMGVYVYTAEVLMENDKKKLLYGLLTLVQ